MEEIKTLRQLTHNLNLGPGYNGYAEMVKSINLPLGEYEHLLRFSKVKYQRICFYDTEVLEGIVTCWEPGQKSPTHNYEDSVGWLKVLDGEIEMQHFYPEKGKNEPNFKKTFVKGEVGLLNDNLGFHRFINSSDKRTVAMIFYADKISRWKVWNQKKNEFEVQEVKCDLNLDVN